MVTTAYPTTASTLRLRVLTPADVEHVAALFDRLSPRSRHLRYLAPVRSPSDKSLRRLVAIDHEQHEALGAFEADVLIGAAHYVRDPDEQATAEISVEIADSHQRRGIGAWLLEELGELARDRGIGTFMATVLRENSAVLALLHRTGWPAVANPDGVQLQLSMIPRSAASKAS